MARTPQGWKLRWPGGEPGEVIAHVRFTHQRRRYDVTTGTRDAGEASTRAARIYADIVAGRVRLARGALVHPATSTAELCAKWLVAVESELSEYAGPVLEVYARHWSRAMPTIGDFDTAGLGNYQRARFGAVTRATVLKELSAIRRFLRWCKEQRIISEVPEFPELPRRALGKRHAQGRSRPTEVMAPDECEAVLSDMLRPDFLTVLWLTALRPRSTLARLEPRDMTPFGLVIRPEADKNGWGRTVPVSDRARAILERALPFGDVQQLESFKAAVRRVLGPERHFTPYDLKHARITSWVDAGMPLGGISFLTGVSIPTLTKRYAHASRRAAEEIIQGNTGATMVKTPQKDRAEPEPSVEGEASTEAFSVDENAHEPVSIGAAKRTSRPGSGALHQNLPAQVRIALFERSRGAA